MYKVVTNKNGELFSASMNNESFCIQYIPGEWVDPKENTGGIFVFKEFKHALYFINTNSHSLHCLECWKCEAEDVESFDYISYYYDSYDLIDFWDMIKANVDINIMTYNVNTAPIGTHIASKVKLLEKVM